VSRQITITRETIMQAIADVDHPEIAASLIDLGMVGDIDYSAGKNLISFTIVIPFMGIPAQIKQALAYNLYTALQPLGADVEFLLQEMTEEARQHFFAMAKRHWKDEDGAGCGPCGP